MEKLVLLLAFLAQILVLASTTRNYPPRRPPRGRSVRCPRNEIWAPCPEAVCAPKTCNDVGFPIPCLDLNKDGSCPSRPRCICREGFVRNYRGVCIPMAFCPSCGGDRNARSGCGTNCNRLCSNYYKKDVFCTEECLYNACECKHGFVYDEIRRKCVRPNQCRAPPKCKRRNEVYDPCPSNCPARTCGINDAAISCAPALPRGHPKCPPPVCRCRDGFYRNHRGDCVRWKNCPTCPKPNEVYDPCPAGCPPRVCGVDKSLILCEVPPQLGDPRCKPSCRCQDGFVKNQSNICIPEDECPKPCNGDPNAVAGCGVYCNQRCRDVGEEPKFCTLQCYPDSCDCLKGYYLDENTGKCVLPGECTPQCPVNEVYNTCIQGNCKPQNCSQHGLSVPCPRIDPRFCKKGCLCKEGYLRNSEGVCVPSSECPKPCNGDPKAVAGCGVYCNQRCRDVGEEPKFCTLQCYPDSCDCLKGYYLDENTGKCVLPGECTPQCPVNEVYNTCIQGNCKPQNCSQLGLSVPCPRIDPRFCKKGCLCKEGYLRNSKGVCVPSSECPSCAGDVNKVAGCGVYCNQRCTDIGEESKSCIAICYENSCNCRGGYYLDAKTGLCVLPEQCTPSCGGDHNKVPGCGRYCNQRCRDIGQEQQFCTDICYEDACECLDGYYLDENTGFCVLPENCSPQCGENEFYSECTQANCSPDKCTEVGFPVACPAIASGSCKKGCLCKQGFARNSDGVCIPSKECPSCGGDPNAQAGCGGNCNRHCSDIGNEEKPCILICEINGCNCKDGYYYDDSTKRCVLPEQCPSRCGINEEYNDCVNSQCGPQSCNDLGFPTSCKKMDQKYCKTGCRCKSGYVRNNKGVCIPSNECPSCGGDPNAKPGCGGNCNKHCSEVFKKTSFCALSCILNGCDCKDGYYYDNYTKKCVEPQNCTGICPANEVYSSCIQGGCEARNCSQYGQPVPCKKIDASKCIQGCVCKESYLRASNGKCIPAESCPEACTGLNEEYNECTWDCPPRTCQSLGRAYDCPIQTDSNCGPMCKCKLGYYRDRVGQCITEEQCKQCSGPNEFYSCGGACDNVCAKLDEESQDNCPRVNIKCNEWCYCDKGYARARNNTCIPISSCDADTSCGGDPNARDGCGVNCGKRCRDLIKIGPCARICNPNGCDCLDGFYFDSKQYKCVTAEQCTDICPKNEVFEDCSNPTCKAKTCVQVGFPLNCNETCKKGCVCENGYVRNEKGVCIPTNQCPSCGGDPNARSGCGTNCGRRCPNNYENPKFCPRIECVPQLNKCDCKDGYYYDINTKSCVPHEECSPACDASNYEVYDSCVNGGCGWKNCSQVGGLILCIDPITCYKGCKCKDGYYRLDNGTRSCVPEEQCPNSFGKEDYYED